MDSISDAKSPFFFVIMKYSLVVTLIIMIINLLVAVPTGLAEIEAIDADNGTNPRSLVNVEANRKEMYVIHVGVNLLIAISGLLGVISEKFIILGIVTLLMIVQAIASFFFVHFTTAILIAIALNIFLAQMMGMFSLMCRNRQSQRELLDTI